jgi:hypothetical protein
MTALDTSGRGWAYTGVVLGGAVSIAANVAHSFIPPKAAPQQWSPEAGAVVGAVVWPVFLFVAVEILARVAWPHGRTWRAVRWAGILPVAIVAALVSYRQLSGLLAHYGEEPVVSILGPLAVDGLMVMATGALIATGHRRTGHHRTGQQGTTSVSDPAAAAPSADPSSSTPPSPVDNLLPRVDTPSAPETPSVVDEPTAAPDPAPTPEPAPPEIPSPAVVAARITPTRPTSLPAGSAAAPRPAAARKPSPRPPTPDTTPATPLAPSATDIPVTAPDAAQHRMPVVPPGLLGKATQVARQYRTEHGTPISAGQLAVRLKVTSEQATQVLALLNLALDSPTRPIPTVNGQPVKASR